MPAKGVYLTEKEKRLLGKLLDHYRHVYSQGSQSADTQDTVRAIDKAKILLEV